MQKREPAWLVEHARVLGEDAFAGHKVLEEPVELVEIAVCGRQKAGWVDTHRVWIGTRDLDDLQYKLVAKALHAPHHGDEIAALETPGERVGVTKRARGDRAALVAQL